MSLLQCINKPSIPLHVLSNLMKSIGYLGITHQQQLSEQVDTSTRTTATSNHIATEIYLAHLDPIILSGLSIGIEVVFIPIFLGLVVFIGVFLSRKDIRNVMARNQKILMTLVIILLILQCIGLTFRGIYDSLTIDIVHKILETVKEQQGNDLATIAMNTMNSTVSAAQAGVSDSQIIALYLMGSFEVMTQIQNMTVILLIIVFIANVFLKTVGMATGIISTTRMMIVHYLVNILGGSAVVLVFVIITATAIAYFIVKIRITLDFQIYLYLIVYIIFVFTVVFLGVISNTVGCVVFNVIRRRTSKLNKQANQQSLKKVVILQLGVNFSALIQLLAGIFIAISSEFSYLKLIFYTLNNVGILVFAVLVYSLYHPLFTGAVNELKEKSTNGSSRVEQSEKSDVKTSIRSDKQKSTFQSIQPIDIQLDNNPQPIPTECSDITPNQPTLNSQV